LLYFSCIDTYGGTYGGMCESYLNFPKSLEPVGKDCETVVEDETTVQEITIDDPKNTGLKRYIVGIIHNCRISI
jgi:hypothetical protein